MHADARRREKCLLHISKQKSVKKKSVSAKSKYGTGKTKQWSNKKYQKTNKMRMSADNFKTK